VERRGGEGKGRAGERRGGEGGERGRKGEERREGGEGRGGEGKKGQGGAFPHFFFLQIEHCSSSKIFISGETYRTINGN
jgi:hypothetical protein